MIVDSSERIFFLFKGLLSVDHILNDSLLHVVHFVEGQLHVPSQVINQNVDLELLLRIECRPFVVELLQTLRNARVWHIGSLHMVNFAVCGSPHLVIAKQDLLERI